MERPRSGLSVASSVATNASVSQGSRPSTRSVKRVHTFGKREYSIKRDPNSPVVIRGWLYKQDSSGLRLWKRRWFVLSDFCLFYYRDSREEIVLGSILLPSYQILPANPREVKNRRFSFKAEHPGMRTYYFGADTHEDMNSWIRAMNQSSLVVSEDRNKNSQVQNLSNSTQEDLYASYEDLSHSGISAAGEHAKSAESLEIAHLSETRSQDESSRESLPEQERNGDFDKDSLFSGLKESLSDAIQHFTTLSQNGSVPPPTPENGVKGTDFPYSRLELENQRSLERKDSIPEDEEWVPFHKDELSIKEPLESYSSRSPPRVPPKGFECPHDVYSSPLSRSAPSSPAVLPGHMYISEAGERNARDGKYVTQSEPPESPQIRLQSPISSCSPPRVTTCPSPEIREFVIQRLVKPSRSFSLPPTPSELPRHRMSKMSPPPSVKYGGPFICEKSMQYSDTSHASPGPPVGSPTRKDILYNAGRSPKSQPNSSQAASNEDLAVSASPSLGRTTVRSNTPIGRVDMVPAEDKAGNFIHSPRHIEDRAGEYFVTSSRTRGHMMKSLSRPQTPSDRYDVLPTEERYSSSTIAKGPNRYSRRTQPLGAEDERLVDGCGMPIPQRTHAYPNSRMQMRPSTPAERVIVEECPSELSLTPSLRRHGSQVTRYSERPLLPQGTFSGRAVGSAPRQLQKMGSSSYSQLPPLPPVAGRPGPHVPAGKRMSLSAMPSGSAPYRERVPYQVRLAENNIDVLLTKLCGQDKLLVSLEDETAHLRAEKEKLEDALQATHHHLEEFQGQDHVIENIWYQQRLLQDDLVYVRARLCDLTLERERAWEEYRGLDNELLTVRETLDRVGQIGHPQDQLAAQRDLWMINDIISGLRFNKSTIHVLPESSRHPGMMIASSPVSETQPAYQRSFLHHSGLHPAAPRDAQKDSEAVPPRPPLPRDHHSAASTDMDGKNRGGSTEQNEQELPMERLTDSAPSAKAGQQPASTPGDVAIRRDVGGDPKPQSSCPVAIPTGPKVISEAKVSPPCLAEVGTVRKQRMSAEEQMERMRRHQEAQIHERPKPGVTTQRQNSQRGSTPVISRLRSASSGTISSGTISPGPNSPQVDSACPEQRRPALVKVTASFYPSTTSTPQPGKGGSIKPKAASNKVQENQAVGYYTTDDPTYSLVMEPQSESIVSTTCHEISPMAKMTPPLRTSSKIVTAACKQAKWEPQGDKEQRLNQATPSPERKPDSVPELLEVKKKAVERAKTATTKTSPATSPGCSRHSDDDYKMANSGQRERIISLSYTLASEASELSKLMTAKTLADEMDANSDVSTSDEAYPWDFIMQDSRSSKHPETSERCQLKGPPDAPQGEDRNANVAENCQTYCSTNQCSSSGPCSPQLQHRDSPKGHTDNQHYENWPAPREKGSTDNCPKIPQDSTVLSKCNGQVANYEFLIQDLHYNPLNISKVTDYCKEDREPIRITLLQSSF
ncbi:pleckstrin homology domain-containing family A member 4 [Xenopus tropicalis]|uniref:LOC100170544 protein n=1 Tax=Xenopus tropicalis TaxID=8364 RepID=B3DLU3_XENTR|nr:pleckstrin homology domain-containing family A member 4 [Xenopus tropicalis]AAI67582.1 LOC100170544 protein [Xenopus tropicalis]|eukprot:NP_001123793.1 pleckstrin homology domain-containing family A member 4 [Xenopus tropicalis]